MVVHSLTEHIAFSHFRLYFTAKPFEEIQHFPAVTSDVRRYVPDFVVGTSHYITINKIVFAEFAVRIVAFKCSLGLLCWRVSVESG